MRLIYHPRAVEHRQAQADHPECPERLRAIRARLEQEGLWTDVVEPEPVDLEDCHLAHGEGYLKRLATFGEGSWDGDTYVRPETFELARLAAGGACLAAETAWTDRRAAISLARPPGHHATRDQAMGFCYLSNVAIAALGLVRRFGARPAIIDIDVHHGNGTQDVLYERDDVLFISLHQWPLYPGTGGLDETGAGAGRGFTVNVPLPPGAGDATYAYAMDRLVAPVLGRFKPSILLVSLGADAHYMDPLAGMALTSRGYLDLTRRISTMAASLCGGRIAFALEGGYHLEALADVICGIVAQNRKQAFTPEFTQARSEGDDAFRAVDLAAKAHGAFWNL